MAGQRAPLEDFRAPAKLKIAALWASTMLCYIYCDYFGLFVPNALAAMNSGKLGPLGPATPGMLVGVSVMMAIPSIMVFASLVLPPRLDRWLNFVLGVIYSAIMIVTLPGAPPFYWLFALVEIAMTLAIAWVAWTWPSIGRPA